MPTTRAALRDQGVEFTSHVDDISACAPGRATLLTGLAEHNHGIGAANNNDDFWNYYRSAAGKNLAIGRTDSTAGTVTALVGPHESMFDDVQVTAASQPSGAFGFATIDTLTPHGLVDGQYVMIRGMAPASWNTSTPLVVAVQSTTRFSVIYGYVQSSPPTAFGKVSVFDANQVQRNAIAGCIFNWLKRIGVTTGLVGKLQNQSHTPDFRSTAQGGTMNNGAPSLAQARGEHTRTPPDIDYYAGSAGAVSTNASNNPAAFYQAAGDVTACCTQNADGTVTIKTKNAQDSVTLPDVGDLLVVQGLAGHTAFAQVYEVADAATYSSNGVTAGAKTFLGVPAAATGYAAGTTEPGGTVTCWKFTGGQHAPRHSIICRKDAQLAPGVAGTGVLTFHDADNGAAGNSGSDPLHALPTYETDALADYAVEFIANRSGVEPWFLYLAPQVPHLGWDDFEVASKYRFTATVTATAGSSSITAAAGIFDSSHVGWQINYKADGSTDARIPNGAIIGSVTTVGGTTTLGLVDTDGTALACGGSGSGSSSMEFAAVPYTGFAGWHNTAGQVAPTMGDRQVQSIVVASLGGNVRQVDVTLRSSTGQSTLHPMVLVHSGIAGLGDVFYVPRATRVSGTQFRFTVTNGSAIPVGTTNYATTDLCSMVTETNLHDWQGRHEKLRSVDDLIGRVLSALTARGWADQCVIILTGDNGQQMGEHSLDESNDVWGNTKATLWMAALRTQLLVRAPGWPRGVQRQILTWHADIPLGVLDWFGMTDAVCTDVLGHNPHSDRDGVSLKRLFETPAAAQGDRAVSLTGTFLGVASSLGLIERSGLKVAQTNGGATTKLHDTFNDEGEQSDIYASNTGRAATMMTRAALLQTKRGQAYRTN